jgi:hypothetical protein
MAVLYLVFFTSLRRNVLCVHATGKFFDLFNTHAQLCSQPQKSKKIQVRGQSSKQQSLHFS